jgi:hypothetical protein
MLQVPGWFVSPLIVLIAGVIPDRLHPADSSRSDWAISGHLNVLYWQKLSFSQG